MEKCKICEREFKTRVSLTVHTCKSHNLSAKEYYDKFLKKEDEDVCKCGYKTSFLDSIRGYQKHCSSKCARLDKDVQDKAKKTNLERYGCEHPKQSELFKQKEKNTKLERYGDENFNNSEKNKKTKLKKYGNKNFNNLDKAKKTNLERYGCEHPTQSKNVIKKRDENNFRKYGKNSFVQTDLHRKYMEENYEWTPIECLNEKEIYYKKVNIETKKWKKQIFEQWDGKDFYTGEKLLVNEDFKKSFPNKDIRTNKLQPTIDHKISVIFGFQNKIDLLIIGNIKNLCICSRFENGKKWRRNYE